MSRPVLSQINVVSADMERSIAFYRLLGLEIEDTAEEWARDHRNAATDSGGEVEFDSHASIATWDRGWTDSAPRVVLGFEFPSRSAVNVAYADLIAAGYAGQQEPHDAFFGARYAVVIDPDGNLVGLKSPIDDAMRHSQVELSQTETLLES
jgi:catechol 2,3-dioxygenase-like lactoylglutathione lyase family enzyme